MLCCVNISFNFLLIVVNDEELKKRIAEELALERARRDSEAQKRRLTGSRNLRKQLKQEQMYVRDEFGKLLERERISSNEHLTRAILRERAATEEERQKAQRFVSSEAFMQPCLQTYVTEYKRTFLEINYSIFKGSNLKYHNISGLEIWLIIRIKKVSFLNDTFEFSYVLKNNNKKSDF
uniref:Uncharacterized protein n=1 Tax=Accipiter nisus TaxID=211598 RepID=A0A8B9MR90_9AVES